MKTKGTLYIVATPIGNLGDMTFRAVEVLKSVGLIAAEDTRKTKKLLSSYDIHTPLISYHEHNEIKKSGQVIELINNGKDVALVSEAGTPSISDPGYRLLSSAAEAGIKLVPIPGATAAIAALSVSGLPTDRFIFAGFLPDKGGKRIKKLEEIKDEKATLIFYVSKWKVEKTLEDMIKIFGNRRACFCRELTKIHEEIGHTTLSEILNSLKNRMIRGEVTLVIEGKTSSKNCG